MRLYKIVLASLLVTAGCYTAASEPLPLGETGTTSADTAASNNGSKTTKAPSSTQTKTTTCDQDADVCDGTQIATRIVITLDGVSCSIDPDTGNGLDMGSPAWIESVTSTDPACAGGFILTITALDNGYPQTEPIEYLQEPTIALFMSDGDVNDAGVGGEFVSTAGGSVEIESGPVDGVAKTIKGHGTVPGSSGSGSHAVTFEMDF